MELREKPTIAVTSGEPAGIGPELVAMLAIRHEQQPFAARLVVLGDRVLLAERAARIGATLDVVSTPRRGTSILLTLTPSPPPVADSEPAAPRPAPVEVA